jgi:hypothetical protein
MSYSFWKQDPKEPKFVRGLLWGLALSIPFWLVVAYLLRRYL